MKTSQVKIAAAEYANGNYLTALEIYKRLGKEIGEAYFVANIRLCERFLSQESVLPGSHESTANLMEVLEKNGLRQNNEKFKKPVGEFKKKELIELSSKEPVWFSIPVKPKQELIIKASVKYCNTAGVLDRKAVLLINSFDAQGDLLDKPCGKMSKSVSLKAFFKYLPCTKNNLQDLHAFTVPDEATEIQLGVCGFNKKDGEQVFIRDLEIKPKIDKSPVNNFVAPSAQAAEISILGWPEYPPNGKPYVIGVMDEFTTGCFEHDVNLIQPRPDNWYALAEKYSPAFFFIESAWKGNFGSWQYRVANYTNKPGFEIAHICQYAREKGIPTVFWNKEDPVHHEKFMCSAELVDYIFTTDANMKASYLAKTGNRNVHELPFAAQPALHKPAPLEGRKQRACFAGSWYGERHAERGEAMQWLLKAATSYGLDIYDRNYGTGVFPFPEDYKKSIKGSLPYKELCVEYNRYRVFLNVNSVTDSPTMFSRRVFELLACGTPVVSTYAKGIEHLFDAGIVWLVHNQKEANEALHTLMTDDIEWRRRSLAGIREVFAKHTYAHRLNDIFKVLGLSELIPTNPKILLIVKVKTVDEIKAIENFAHEQSYQEFSIGVECSQEVIAQIDTISNKLKLLLPGEKVNWFTQNSDGAQLAGWLSINCFYGKHYLRDLANASIYEPAAKGWAKSIGDDYFSYGRLALMCGGVWKINYFINEYLENNVSDIISHPDLYVVDGDQFVK